MVSWFFQKISPSNHQESSWSHPTGDSKSIQGVCLISILINFTLKGGKHITAKLITVVHFPYHTVDNLSSKLKFIYSVSINKYWCIVRRGKSLKKLVQRLWLSYCHYCYSYLISWWCTYSIGLPVVTGRPG